MKKKKKAHDWETLLFDILKVSRYILFHALLMGLNNRRGRGEYILVLQEQVVTYIATLR